MPDDAGIPRRGNSMSHYVVCRVRATTQSRSIRFEYSRFTIFANRVFTRSGDLEEKFSCIKFPYINGLVSSDN